MNFDHVTLDVFNEIMHYPPSAHGGYYIDKDNPNTFHVNVPLKSKMLLNTASDNIKYHPVKFSKEELFDYKQAIRENLLGEYGVHLVASKPKENNLEIGVLDDDTRIVDEIRNELNKFDIPEDAYTITKHRSFDTLEGKLGSPLVVPQSRLSSYDYQHQVMAGGWIGMGSISNGNIIINSYSSVTCGFQYNNWYGFLTCGHGRTVGKSMFWAAPPPSTGTYPSDLMAFTESWLVPLGTIQLVDYTNAASSYLCDLSSTRREYDTTIMAGHTYGGDVISSCGVEPYVGADGFFSGCANKREACTVYSDSADVTDMRTNRMDDLFLVNAPGIRGTSGGPFYYKHVFNPNANIVAGMACTTDYDTFTGFAKTSHALSRYEFIPYF